MKDGWTQKKIDSNQIQLIIEWSHLLHSNGSGTLIFLIIS